MSHVTQKSDSILIAYASEGGNSKALAEDFAKRCQSLSLGVEVLSLNGLIEQDFAKSSVICFVSTTGNGEFPVNGKQFVERFNALDQEFESLNYALFSLGSRSYSQFCGAGQSLHKALQTKQACSIQSPIFAGDDFHYLYAPWALAVLAELTGLSLQEVESELDEFAKKPKASYQLLTKVCLTSNAAQQKIYHLVLEPVNEGLNYTPGDVISIQPDNPVERVEAFIELLQLPLDAQVKRNGNFFSLKTYLTTQVEMTKINAELIKKTGALLSDWGLLTGASDANKLKQMESQFDVFHWFQAYTIPIEHRLEWLGSLPIKTPRYYSIASESGLVENQLHLTVGLQSQSFEGDSVSRFGLGSGTLCHDLNIGEPLDLSLEVHSNFHLQLEKPMVWVATGTGIAPFIGFLMQLSQMFPGSSSEVVLCFGVRHSAEDFLYRAFLESCHEQGLIELRMVFSREGRQKKYVQHVLSERVDELADCITKEGHVYVCGGASMWEEVEVVFQHAVFASCGSMEKAKQFWPLFSESQLHKDIY